MEYDLTVIIPTLNEAEVIEETITKVDEVLKSNNIKGEILVVDDNSSMDTTIFILVGLKRRFSNFNFIVRQRDHGLSQSLVDGFKIAKANMVMVIDADGQHPIDKIAELYKTLLKGYDIALGSRYMGIEGSGFAGLAYYRRLLSWGASYIARIIFPSITDSGSGFFVFRKEVIKDAPLKPQGFRMLFEILGKGHWKRVKEIPIIFGMRKKGVSKLTRKTITDYLKQLWDLLAFSLAHPDSHGYKELKRLVTYMCVGTLGAMINIGLMYILTEFFGMWYVAASLMGIEISILSNFFLNSRFTFNDVEHLKYPLYRRVITYHLVSAIGIIINITVLFVLTEYLGIWYVLSAILGILIAFIWNFSVNRGITWGSAE